MDDTYYSIDVNVFIPESVSVDHSRSRAELGNISAHSGPGRVLGLMRSQLDVRSGSSVGYIETDGGYCFWLEAVEVELEFPALEIFVAREYPQGSCGWRNILEHEERHLAVAKTVLDPYAAEMRAALTSYALPKPLTPWFVTSLEEGEARAQAALGQLLNPIYHRLQVDMAQRQAVLDTPEEYRRILRRCKNW